MKIHVEVHAELVQVGLDVAKHQFHAERTKDLLRLVVGQRRDVVLIGRCHTRGNVTDVRAAVTVFGSGPTQVGGNEAAGKTVNLRPVIIEVVLARHVGALRNEDAREAVAHGRPSGAPHVNRSGWVGGHELKVHGYAAVQRSVTKVGARGHDGASKFAGRAGVERDVDEARPGHVRTCHAVNPGQVIGHLGREVTGIHPDRFCDLEGNARRPVSVVTVLGAFDHNVGYRE